MMKPRFVVFRQRRYGFKKISMKNISGEKSYDLQLFDYFSTFSKFENFQIFSFGNSAYDIFWYNTYFSPAEIHDDSYLKGRD